MQRLSASGQHAVNELAERHGFSPDAVAAMFDAVARGNGSLAQFSHPEFGGSGQWMRGGMIMVGDMFNTALKSRVDALCNDLSGLAANQTDLIETARGTSGSGDWWPGDLGVPNSTGAQNDQRYAYFARRQRLAIDADGKVTVYDTGDHRIGGVSQQQSGSHSLTFSSQHGPVDVESLPMVSGLGAPPQSPANPPPPDAHSAQSGPDVFAAIEKLSGLRGKGALSEEEFKAKKAELLSRI